MNNRKPKVRRRDYSSDVYDNFEYHSAQNSNNFDEIERVKFQNNETDIILDRKINYIFTPGRCGGDAFSVSLLMSTDYWHCITVSKSASMAFELFFKAVYLLFFYLGSPSWYLHKRRNTGWIRRNGR